MADLLIEVMVFFFNFQYIVNSFAVIINVDQM